MANRQGDHGKSGVEHSPEVVNELLNDQFSRILENLNHQPSSRSNSSNLGSFPSSFGSTASTDHSNTYIIDCTRPGQLERNHFEVKRSDIDNPQLPTCVRGSSQSTWNKKKRKEVSSSKKNKDDFNKSAHPQNHPPQCTGKCCRPLFTLPAHSLVEEDETAECKYRGTSNNPRHKMPHFGYGSSAPVNISKFNLNKYHLNLFYFFSLFRVHVTVEHRRLILCVAPNVENVGVLPVWNSNL